LCKWKNGAIAGCGVGNVEIASAKTRLPVVLTPGIVGVNVRRVSVFEGGAGPGVRVVLYSDGIASSILSEDIGSLPRASACDTLMEKFRKKHDDATVLVADVHN